MESLGCFFGTVRQGYGFVPSQEIVPEILLDEEKVVAMVLLGRMGRFLRPREKDCLGVGW